MNREQAIEAIQESCKEIALRFMKIHPAIRALDDPGTQETCIRSLHAMTTELEIIKKHLLRLQNRDDSPEL